MIPSDLSPATVRLRVKLKDGEIRLADGSALPALRPDTVGELTLPLASLVNLEDRRLLSMDYQVLFLPAETELWIRVSETTERSADQQKLLRTVATTPASGGFFVSALLKENLNLQIRAGKHSKLMDAEVTFPDLDGLDGLKDGAASVNEAYSKVSTVFEPGRRSHSGNVFREVFYGPIGSVRRFSIRRSECELLPPPPEPSDLLFPHF